MTGGRLGDIFGRSGVLIGVTEVTIMSALWGPRRARASPLRPGRPGRHGRDHGRQVPAVIQVIFPPAEPIQALTGLRGDRGLGTVSGPLLGGLLIQHDRRPGRRPIFVINVRIGSSPRSCPRCWSANPAHPAGPGWTRGVVLPSVALLLLADPLVEGARLGWPGWTSRPWRPWCRCRSGSSGGEQVKTRRDGSPLVLLRRPAAPVQRGHGDRHDVFLGIARSRLVLTCSCSLASASPRCTPG